MKKILSLAVLLAFSLAMYAQKDVTKFLGIPVDGTKSEMIKKLKEKGFTSTLYDKDVLEGEFNGMDVLIFIITNNNKVWRIAVADANNTTDEANIRIRFNNLCKQFEYNKKYRAISSLQNFIQDFLYEFASNKKRSTNNYIIPDDENISYEMKVKNKRYEASYYQLPDSAYIAQRELTKSEMAATDSIPAGMDKKEWLASYKFALCTFEAAANKSVWFMIAERLGGYYIAMYYDNKYNQAQGEDL